MRAESPQWWDSLESPPELIPTTPEETEEIFGVAFPADALDFRTVNDLITIYGKAVGYEAEQDILICIKSVGLHRWNYETGHPIFNTSEPIDITQISSEWRIGSPGWPHTKIKLRPFRNGLVGVRMDPNTPYNERGLDSRMRSARLYFAEMAAGYLEKRGLLVRIDHSGAPIN